MLKKIVLSFAASPALTGFAIAHSDPSAHGAVMTHVAHIHFGSGQAVALGIVGIFVAGMITAVIMTKSATKPPLKRH